MFVLLEFDVRQDQAKLWPDTGWKTTGSWDLDAPAPRLTESLAQQQSARLRSPPLSVSASALLLKVSLYF